MRVAGVGQAEAIFRTVTARTGRDGRTGCGPSRAGVSRVPLSNNAASKRIAEIPNSYRIDKRRTELFSQRMVQWSFVL